MNPVYDEDPPPSRPESKRLLASLLGLPIRGLLAILLWELAKPAGDKPSEPKTLGRLLGIVFARLAYVPLLIPFIVAACVYIGTHPNHWASSLDPSSRGVYYDPVAWVTADDVRLEGWLIPVTDEQSIMRQGARGLGVRYPAVVLAHDDQSNRSQLLPLVRPLRDAGFVVLVAGLRTSGAGGVGGTFGIREQADVRAAVEFLATRSGIDPNRIAVVGTGSGANAALLAAEEEPRIAALVLDRPTHEPMELVARRIVPPGRWLRWLTPLCKWGVEMAYKVDVDDLRLDRHRAILSSRPVLIFDDSTGPSPTIHSDGIARIVTFLQHHANANSQAEIDQR